MNNIANEVGTIATYQVVINKTIMKSPHSNIATSPGMNNLGGKNINRKVTVLNDKPKKLCEEKHIDYINNDR